MFCCTEMLFLQPVLFIWSIWWSVSCVWLNETYQMNLTNHMNQIDLSRLSRVAILRIAALTALKLPLYPVQTSWGKSLYAI
jgi:hypothetical protein